jgi:hypothetical protein
MADTTADTLRCSTWTRANHVSPIGSAGSHRGYLLVELRMPWPPDIAETALVSALAHTAGQAGLRVQTILDPKARQRRLIAYLNPSPHGFTRYQRHQSQYGDDPAADLQALLAAPAQPDPNGAEPAHQQTPDQDLLVCIHGMRDFCCGSLGAALAVTLTNQPLPPGVRLWRTSHTGGHRFAPNLILLPQGTLWAYADQTLAQQVLTRSGPIDQVVEHYRGCAGLPGPQVQALEKEVLRHLGWDLFDQHRSGQTNPDGTTTLTLQAPSGQTQTWQAQVTPGRTLPVPDCGKPIQEATKSETEWTVTNLHQTSS